MKKSVLSKIDIFQGLDKKQIQLVFQYAKSLELKPKDVLCRQDEAADSLYIIIKGSVSIFKRDPESDEDRFITNLSENTTIGEMSLIEEKPRSATIVANENVELYEIPFSAFRKNAELYSGVVKNISLILAKRMRNY